MINTARALYEFFSGFGIPAYAENNVPDEAEKPYITYPIIETESLYSSPFYCRVWYRARDYGNLLQKVDAILEATSDGVRIECDGGCVVLRPDTPRVQIQSDENPDYQYAYMVFQLNCYHM